MCITIKVNFADISIFFVAAKRSRLVTVTMDGKLDIWDFDVAGQVIFKDRSSENQPKLIKETISDRVIGLKSCPFFHGLCMVLTRKNAIVSFFFTWLLGYQKLVLIRNVS